MTLVLQQLLFEFLPPNVGNANILQIFLAMDFCHRSHLIHSDMKLAQVLIKGPVVLQPQSTTSAAADRGPIPVVHVKVAGSFPIFNRYIAPTPYA